jgi:hypothetical protein
MDFTIMNVKRTERGWGGHYILADRCLFRRNTLLVYDDIKIVVSTVGAMFTYKNGVREFETIGNNHYFETVAFHVDKDDTKYYDADIKRQIYFTSPWKIKELDADDRANDMHENVCSEIEQRLIDGDVF